MAFHLFFTVIFIHFIIISGRSIDEHPRYTAARLTDQYKHVLEGTIKLEDTHLFFDQVSVNYCGESGDYDFLVEKIHELIPTVDQVQLILKFAYPVPFTNNTIEFSVDEILTLKDGTTHEDEKAVFARLDENIDEYKIFKIKVVPCYKQQ